MSVWKAEDDGIGIFSTDIESEELEWHVDFEDRYINVVQSGGWSFQFDNEIPFLLVNGQDIFIKECSWHKIYKGTNKLIIKITSK